MVVQGQGTAVVMAVGKLSRRGVKPDPSLGEADESPLQAKLTMLSAQFSLYAIYAAVIIFFALTIHMLFKIMIQSQ